MKTYHFISGLPRSGSSLLSALFQQRNIYSDIASPINAIVSQLLATSSDGFNKILTEDKVKDLIKNTFDVMYSDRSEEIIIDTNRCWSGKTDIIKDIFPGSKIICCVRSIGDILNSFENVYRKNKYSALSPIYNDPTSVYSRSRDLLNEGGVLGVGLNNLKMGLHTESADILFLVEYDELVSNTQEIMDMISDFLEIEKYEHDLSNIPGLKNIDKIDTELNLMGLHEVRTKVERRENPMLLPYDLLESLQGMEYWRKLFEQYNPEETE